MKKAFLASLALIASCSIAQAQVGFGGMFPGPGMVHTGGGGGGYSGMGDVQAYSYYHGLSAYNAAYAAAGGLAIQICTAADANCYDIHVTSTGGLNASELTASGCTTSCTVKIKYDQTGNGHNATQNTISARLVFSTGAGCPNTALPCAKGTLAASTNYVLTGTFTVAQPLQFVLVAARTGNLSTQMNVFETGPGGIQLGYAAGPDAVIDYYGNCCAYATASDNAMHVVQFLGNGASGSTTVDATNTGAVNNGSNALSGDTLYFSGAASGKSATMTWVMDGLIPADGTANNTATCHTAYAYWGTSVSC